MVDAPAYGGRAFVDLRLRLSLEGWSLCSALRAILVCPTRLVLFVVPGRLCRLYRSEIDPEPFRPLAPRVLGRLCRLYGGEIDPEPTRPILQASILVGCSGRSQQGAMPVVSEGSRAIAPPLLLPEQPRRSNDPTDSMPVWLSGDHPWVTEG